MVDPEKVTIVITMGHGWVRSQEIYPCTNPSCPEDVHSQSYRTHEETIKMLDFWSKRVLSLTPEPAGYG